MTAHQIVDHHLNILCCTCGVSAQPLGELSLPLGGKNTVQPLYGSADAARGYPGVGARSQVAQLCFNSDYEIQTSYHLLNHGVVRRERRERSCRPSCMLRSCRCLTAKS